MKTILSIDCATKSLGYSILLYNDIWNKNIREINEKFRKEYNILETNSDKLLLISTYIDNINDILENIIILSYVNVIDLIPGKKVNDVSDQEKAISLKRILIDIEDKGRNINQKNSKHDETIFDIILLEFQEGRNYKSRFIYSCLLYHFSTPDNKTEIFRISPSLKASVYFSENGKYEYFIRKYINNYTSNKNHSKYNFLLWMNKKGLNDMLIKIKKKNIDDAGDSFLMAYAWMKKQFNITFDTF